MKYKRLVILFIIVILSITGCKNIQKSSEKSNRFALSQHNSLITDISYNDIYVIVDRKTGVNYIMVEIYKGGAITPLLGKDGKPIITK